MALDHRPTPDLAAFCGVLATLEQGARVALQYRTASERRRPSTVIMHIDWRWYGVTPTLLLQCGLCLRCVSILVHSDANTPSRDACKDTPRAHSTMPHQASAFRTANVRVECVPLLPAQEWGAGAVAAEPHRGPLGLRPGLPQHHRASGGGGGSGGGASGSQLGIGGGPADGCRGPASRQVRQLHAGRDAAWQPGPGWQGADGGQRRRRRRGRARREGVRAAPARLHGAGEHS